MAAGFIDGHQHVSDRPHHHCGCENPPKEKETAKKDNQKNANNQDAYR